jgi:hypothetical protein
MGGVVNKLYFVFNLEKCATLNLCCQLNTTHAEIP